MAVLGLGFHFVAFRGFITWVGIETAWMGWRSDLFSVESEYWNFETAYEQVGAGNEHIIFYF